MVKDYTLLEQSDNASLMVAAIKGQTERVQQLLEAGATVKYQNKVMTTPFIQAAVVSPILTIDNLFVGSHNKFIIFKI